MASPTITHIDHAIDRTLHQLDQLQVQQTTRGNWLQQHPDALHRLTAVDAKLTAVELDRRFDAAHSLGPVITEPRSPGPDRGLQL